jgi:predicted nucleic acid-binding protein
LTRCVDTSVASRNGLPLVTFDKQLARCAEMLGQAVELIA